VLHCPSAIRSNCKPLLQIIHFRNRAQPLDDLPFKVLHCPSTFRTNHIATSNQSISGSSSAFRRPALHGDAPSVSLSHEPHRYCESINFGIEPRLKRPYLFRCCSVLQPFARTASLLRINQSRNRAQPLDDLPFTVMRHPSAFRTNRKPLLRISGMSRRLSLIKSRLRASSEPSVA